MLEAQQILHNRYKLLKKLGHNAGRQTWLAEDLQMPERLSVVKLLAFGGDVQWDDLKLFEREANILQQLQNSQIPKYYDYFSIDDRFLWFGLVQEYIPGSSLKQLLNESKRLTEAKVQQITKEILEILIYLHSLNPILLHRDIKPSNLILGENDQIYLVDFGAVQDKAAAEGATFTIVGTYGYAPMEQYGGRAIPASDLYALGATIIHLLGGVAPGDLPQKELQLQFRDRLSQQSVSANFITWLEKAIQPAPENRFQSANQALQALEAETIPTSTSSYYKPGQLPPPVQTSIKIAQTPEQLKIIIPSRLKFDKIPAPLTIVVLACLLVFLTPVGLTLLILIFTQERLFAETKLELSQDTFTISKKFLGFYTSKQIGITNAIQDISIYYKTSSYSARGIIIVSNPSHAELFNKNYFGRKLKEAELIWIVQKIRAWLVK
ncbi:MAG: serine/threonine-protein kinase [Spirulinaceae cyanobacterium]